MGEYIGSMKKVWRWIDGLSEFIYSYRYEESTLDGISDFSAEVILVDKSVDENAALNIETFPHPTVVHYVSFDRYSYLDWFADIGGFSTLIFGIFFSVSALIIWIVNWQYAFQRTQGILPVFSLPHRNAEELTVLRYFVIAALGITEEDYFT